MNAIACVLLGAIIGLIAGRIVASALSFDTSKIDSPSRPYPLPQMILLAAFLGFVVWATWAGSKWLSLGDPLQHDAYLLSLLAFLAVSSGPAYLRCIKRQANSDAQDAMQ